MIRVDQVFDITYIDPSSFSTFNRCPAMYMFSRQMGLVSHGSNKIALDYGTVLHIVLPHCYSDPQQALKTFKEEWAKYPYGEEDPKRNTARAAASITDFYERHQSNPYEILDLKIDAPTHDVISKNEVPFLIDIGGPLAFAGRIDAIVKWIADSSLWALDYKTASEVSARYFKSFEGAPATIGYTLATMQLLGLKVDGLIIEAVRTTKANPSSDLELVFVQEHQIESLILQMNNKAKEILFCNENKTWFKQFSGCSCYTMFGTVGYSCPYMNICNSPDWEDAAQYYEKEEPFHPFVVRR